MVRRGPRDRNGSDRGRGRLESARDFCLVAEQDGAMEGSLSRTGRLARVGSSAQQGRPRCLVGGSTRRLGLL
jgi:hypothetical protein